MKTARDSETSPDHAAHSAHVRSVPHDVERLRYSGSYVLASAPSKHAAEAGVRKLSEAGFEIAELVLVSANAGTLRPFPDEDPLEIERPEDKVRESGRVGGLITGAVVGALLAVAAVYVAGSTAGSSGLAAGLGALLGAGVGLVSGQWVASRLTRGPARCFADLVKHEGDVLVGVGFEKDADKQLESTAMTSLRSAGLEPFRMEGASGPARRAAASASA